MGRPLRAGRDEAARAQSLTEGPRDLELPTVHPRRTPSVSPTPRLGYEEPLALESPSRKGTEFGKEAELWGSPSLCRRESPDPPCGSRAESWLGSQAQQRS